MKKSTNTNSVPSTREESVDLIIREFLNSDKNKLKLLLYPTEIPRLNKEYKDIIVHNKNTYHPDNELSLFLISKHKHFN